MFQGRIQRNSITFFSAVVKITCRAGRTHGACWEAHIEGRTDLEGRAWPSARVLPSAQPGDNISLTCQDLSGHQHPPSGTGVFQRALGPRQLKGQRKVYGGSRVPFPNPLSVPRVWQGPYPYPSHSLYQPAPDTDWAWLFDHEDCLKKMKNWK